MAKRRTHTGILKLRLPEALREALTKLAFDRGQTVSEMVRGLVRKEVAKAGAA